MSKRILVKNALVVSDKETRLSDILIENGLIVQVTQNMSVEGAELINANFNYVTPGGIDAHVHLQLQTAYATIADSFREGSLAALAGGTTTLIDFVTPQRNESLVEATLKRKKEAADSLVDYALHGSVTAWNENTAAEMKLLAQKEGITSFKVYMAYKKSIGIDDAVLYKTLKTAAGLGVVVLSHCENGDVIDIMQEEALREGRVEALNHALTRPAVTEAEAVNRVLMMADITRAPLYIVHVSTKQAAMLIRKARKSNNKIFAETCPHYLLLNNKAFAEENPEKYIMSPPLRKQSDCNYLWGAINEGFIDVVSTDHCSYRLKDKIKAKKFTEVPNGIAGIETRLSLLATYGLVNDYLDMNRFVALTAANPARIFGLYPRKGVIAPGADADVVIWQQKNERISASALHQNTDHTVFEGFACAMKPQTVIVNGRVGYHKGKLSTEGLKGRYLKRGKCEVGK